VASLDHPPCVGLPPAASVASQASVPRQVPPSWGVLQPASPARGDPSSSSAAEAAGIPWGTGPVAGSRDTQPSSDWLRCSCSLAAAAVEAWTLTVVAVAGADSQAAGMTRLQVLLVGGTAD